jgi:Asp-tRNA(Asn)/Glu-tRNA(Gln) amidotransferase A subunit family amidase
MTKELRLLVSVQFAGRPFAEAVLYRVARSCEDASGWMMRRPAGLAD